ncbi:MAG: SDR family oxidoreductase [Acidobacteriota bacterium]
MIASSGMGEERRAAMQAKPGLHVVTGAFGYSGRYISKRLLAAGHRVRTLTNSPDRANPFGTRVEVHPFNFEDPDRLTASLAGARVLYNTYWVRFNHATFSHAQAVENTRALFTAARHAGVARVVHISITNPSEDSSLEYFRGKAILERELAASGLSYAILRPAVLFGGEDILINNIAWALRHLPIFGLFGDGQYRLQPIHVHDLANLAVAQGREHPNRVIDAIGPQTFTYRALVTELAGILGVRRLIIPVPPWLGHVAGWLVGKWLRDVLITRDEIDGLMQGLLATASPPAGTTRLTDWARRRADTLGRRYATELGRRRDRRVAYRSAR